MGRKSVRSAAFASVFIAALLGSGHAASQNIGQAVLVENLVVRKAGIGTRQLTTGDDVYFKDRIHARAQSRGQIELIDRTKLVVGAGAEVVLDEFVYTPSRTARSATMTVLKGALRFISGSSPGAAYNIRSPASTMGIRGTAFDMFVGPGGRTAVMVLNGSVRVCDRAGQCRVLDDPCQMVVVDRRSGFVAETRGVDAPVIGTLSMSQAFPFLASQAGLLTPFQVRGAGRCVAVMRRAGGAPAPARAASGSPAPASASAGPGSGGSLAGPGNPGNDKAVGNAGEAPGRGDFGGGAVGRGDAPGRGGGRGRGHR